MALVVLPTASQDFFQRKQAAKKQSAQLPQYLYFLTDKEGNTP